MLQNHRESPSFSSLVTLWTTDVLFPNTKREDTKRGRPKVTGVAGLSLPKGLGSCEDSCGLGSPRDFRSGVYHRLWG